MNERIPFPETARRLIPTTDKANNITVQSWSEAEDALNPGLAKNPRTMDATRAQAILDLIAWVRQKTKMLDDPSLLSLVQDITVCPGGHVHVQFAVLADLRPNE